MPHRPLTSPGCVPGAVTLGCDHKDEEESVGELQGQRLGDGAVCPVCEEPSRPTGPKPREMETKGTKAREGSGLNGEGTREPWQGFEQKGDVVPMAAPWRAVQEGGGGDRHQGERRAGLWG